MIFLPLRIPQAYAIGGQSWDVAPRVNFTQETVVQINCTNYTGDVESLIYGQDQVSLVRPFGEFNPPECGVKFNLFDSIQRAYGRAIKDGETIEICLGDGAVTVEECRARQDPSYIKTTYSGEIKAIPSPPLSSEEKTSLPSAPRAFDQTRNIFIIVVIVLAVIVFLGYGLWTVKRR